MTTNFVNFSKYPWGTQCLEMSKTTGYRSSTYDALAMRQYIRHGDFRNALQRIDSVGAWGDSVQGRGYWLQIHNVTFD